jgi:hypothetical protein
MKRCLFAGLTGGGMAVQAHTYRPNIPQSACRCPIPTSRLNLRLFVSVAPTPKANDLSLRAECLRASQRPGDSARVSERHSHDGRMGYMRRDSEGGRITPEGEEGGGKEGGRERKAGLAEARRRAATRRRDSPRTRKSPPHAASRLGPFHGPSYLGPAAAAGLDPAGQGRAGFHLSRTGPPFPMAGVPGVRPKDADQRLGAPRQRGAEYSAWRLGQPWQEVWAGAVCVCGGIAGFAKGGAQAGGNCACTGRGQAIRAPSLPACSQTTRPSYHAPKCLPRIEAGDRCSGSAATRAERC